MVENMRRWFNSFMLNIYIEHLQENYSDANSPTLEKMLQYMTMWSITKEDGLIQEKMVQHMTRWSNTQVDGLIQEKMVPYMTRWSNTREDGLIHENSH